MQGQTVPNINEGTVVLMCLSTFINNLLYQISIVFIYQFQTACCKYDGHFLFKCLIHKAKKCIPWELNYHLVELAEGLKLLSEYKIFLKHFFHSCVLSSLTSTMTKTCEEEVTLSLPRQCIDLITSVFILQQCARGYTRLTRGQTSLVAYCVPVMGIQWNVTLKMVSAWWVLIFALFVNNPQISLKKK